MGPVAYEEIQLPGKIFGENALKANLSRFIAPNSFVVFCRNHKDQEFTGEDISGFSTQFCNDFSLAPTHTGICITKNLAIEDIIGKLDDEYDKFFEVEKQTSKLNVGKSNYWAVSTFVINVLKIDPAKVPNQILNLNSLKKVRM